MTKKQTNVQRIYDDLNWQGRILQDSFYDELEKKCIWVGNPLSFMGNKIKNLVAFTIGLHWFYALSLINKTLARHSFKFSLPSLNYVSGPAVNYVSIDDPQPLILSGYIKHIGPKKRWRLFHHLLFKDILLIM